MRNPSKEIKILYLINNYNEIHEEHLTFLNLEAFIIKLRRESGNPECNLAPIYSDRSGYYCPTLKSIINDMCFTKKWIATDVFPAKYYKREEFFELIYPYDKVMILDLVEKGLQALKQFTPHKIFKRELENLLAKY